MKRGSIRLRLWSVAAISILVALAAAGIGLSYLFERHVERRVEGELAVDLNQLIGATSATTGVVRVGPVLSDPRFEVPLSGYYWQVEDLTTRTLTRSRSLWDEALILPPEGSNDGSLHSHEIAGPQKTSLIAIERVITDSNGHSFRAAVAEDHQTVAVAVGEYITELAPAVLLLAIVLIAANFFQVSIGLRPLERLRVAVHDVIARRRNRLAVVAPSEVQPLADEIDRLLDAQEKGLARARSRATDLAHGLKTPLQVLTADIRALRAKGETELADEIEGSALAIRRHVERELARARLAPGVSPRATSPIAAVVRDVVQVVSRTPEGAALDFVVDVSAEITADVDPGDLAEVLGNLVENAARFAKSLVRVGAAERDGSTIITIVDDGPGIVDADKPAALVRGIGLDDERSGTGLGLAIVSDIVEAYGGRLELGDAEEGLKVTISFPHSRFETAPRPRVNEPA